MLRVTKTQCIKPTVWQQIKLYISYKITTKDTQDDVLLRDMLTDSWIYSGHLQTATL